MNEQAQSVVLLTAVLGKRTPHAPKPLSVGEWADFARMLHGRGLNPAQLLGSDIDALMADWRHPAITADRIQRLLDRGTALGLCLERWERAGLWLLVRSDPDYPRKLKRHLEWKSPPLLFGCGNRKLVGQRGLAVVGSRNASEADLAAAAQLGREAATADCSIISGGARGVDETAMLAGLQTEGTAIGVLANGLQRAATSRKYRQALQRGDLALISPFAPEAGFHAGNAMARNRYIYCLAVNAVVVASKKNGGGTWRGAIENLEHGWVPMWVHKSGASHTGNSALVDSGAQWLPIGDRSMLFSGNQGHGAKATMAGAPSKNVGRGAQAEQPTHECTDRQLPLQI